MIPNRLLLLSNSAAEGQSASANWEGGIAVLTVAGTLDGATVALELLGPDGETWLPITGGSLTATGVTAALYVPAGTVAANVTGGTPAGLYVALEAVLN